MEFDAKYSFRLGIGQDERHDDASYGLVLTAKNAELDWYASFICVQRWSVSLLDGLI
jgi:hypothetical protein